MIFVTVGTARDFSRLVRGVDKVAKDLKDEVIIQKGQTKYNPKNCKYFDFISRDKFLELIKRADVVITHAGVGTIITCLNAGKAIIVVPRRKKYNEHKNDHQMDITKELMEEGKILACYDIENLKKMINKAKKIRIKSERKKEIVKLGKTLENFINSTKK